MISIIVAVFGVECIASICTVAFTDPGIVPRGTPHNPGNDSYTFCGEWHFFSPISLAASPLSLFLPPSTGICMVYRDNSTFHCQTCNCCIRDVSLMDEEQRVTSARAKLTTYIVGVWIVGTVRSPLPMDREMHWRKEHAVL